MHLYVDGIQWIKETYKMDISASVAADDPVAMIAQDIARKIVQENGKRDALLGYLSRDNHKYTSPQMIITWGLRLEVAEHETRTLKDLADHVMWHLGWR